MDIVQMAKNLLAKGVSPQKMVENLLYGNNSNPVMQNLVQMAKNGNGQQIETFARNLFKEQGRDFDKEFGDFKNNFKSL